MRNANKYEFSPVDDWKIRCRMKSVVKALLERDYAMLIRKLAR